MTRPIRLLGEFLSKRRIVWIDVKRQRLISVQARFVLIYCSRRYMDAFSTEKFHSVPAGTSPASRNECSCRNTGRIRRVAEVFRREHWEFGPCMGDLACPGRTRRAFTRECSCGNIWRIEQVFPREHL